MAIIKRTPRPGELVRGAAAGNLVAFGPDGEPVDSGKEAGDFAEWPTGGNVGDVITKTATGQEWAPPADSLPDVSAADNNKALAVANGVWAAKQMAFYEYIMSLLIPAAVDGHSVNLPVTLSTLYSLSLATSDFNERTLLNMMSYTDVYIDDYSAVSDSGDSYFPIDVKLTKDSSHVYVSCYFIKKDSSGTLSIIGPFTTDLSAAVFNVTRYYRTVVTV